MILVLEHIFINFFCKMYSILNQYNHYFKFQYVLFHYYNFNSTTILLYRYYFVLF